MAVAFIPSESGMVAGMDNAVVFENLPESLQQRLLRNVLTTFERYRVDGGLVHECGKCGDRVRNGEALHVIAGVWLRCGSCYAEGSTTVPYTSPQAQDVVATIYAA